MDIGERILRKRMEMKLTVRALAKLVEASPATVSQWENNRTQPNGKNLNNLAKAFKTTPTWLLNGKDYTANTSTASNVAEAPAQYNTKSLPVLSHVQAGGWMEAIDYRSLGDDIEWEDAPTRASDNSFWLRVVGDSMTSPIGISIPEGMLILVDPDIAPENGKLVVAKLDNTDEATFKKFVIDAGMKSLRPLNTTYPTISINGNCQILGVVIEAKFKL